MYHYIREVDPRYPQFKGLLPSEFREQLNYIKKHYEFVTVKDCIDFVYTENTDFPSNAILLTFDDGYIDHFTEVFPLLEENGIQGCFFPPGKVILNHEVLTVHKIQFILASLRNIDGLLNDIYCCLDKYRTEYRLESNEYYFSKLAVGGMLDPKEIRFVKSLLQVELEEKLRKLITDELFRKYVTIDEAAFSRELYMDIEQLKHMVRNGMYVGSHAYDHNWFNSIPPEKQKKEIDLSLDFLKEVGSSTESWIMCYPHGVYNSSLLNILKDRNCKLAMTVKVDIAVLCKENALTLERLDTNDLPKVEGAEPNLWTKKILSLT
jgi:peptidoglycan/xylan/chitin deacetylase (PgdA/CDA1 family)|tara:strand:- start:15 stop:977 length:963 start_codon:yes stop_codon:yes gene_type:complete